MNHGRNIALGAALGMGYLPLPGGGSGGPMAEEYVDDVAIYPDGWVCLRHERTYTSLFFARRQRRRLLRHLRDEHGLTDVQIKTPIRGYLL